MYLPHQPRFPFPPSSGDAQPSEEVSRITDMLTDVSLDQKQEERVRRTLQGALRFAMDNLRSIITSAEWSGRTLHGSPKHDVLTASFLGKPFSVDLERITPADDGFNAVHRAYLDRQFVRVALAGNLRYSIQQAAPAGGGKLGDWPMLTPDSQPLYCENPEPGSTLRFLPVEAPVLLFTIASTRKIHGQWRRSVPLLSMPQG